MYRLIRHAVVVALMTGLVSLPAEAKKKKAKAPRYDAVVDDSKGGTAWRAGRRGGYLLGSPARRLHGRAARLKPRATRCRHGFVSLIPDP